MGKTTKIKELIDEANEEFEEIQGECIGTADWERDEIWAETYKSDYDDLQKENRT